MSSTNPAFACNCPLSDHGACLRVSAGIGVRVPPPGVNMVGAVAVDAMVDGVAQHGPVQRSFSARPRRMIRGI